MPERPAAVCRELTKRFEEIVGGTVSELASRFTEPPRGEVTLVLGAVDVAGATVEEDALSAVAELVRAGVSRRQAAELVARLTGESRNDLYRGSL
jgi:16S rRNA (cytidine1402-2'-O)-methyltransferase